MKNQIKIHNAKAFANLHKNSILPIGIDTESATDEDWMNIFNYIWENLRSENGESPYIEVRSHETKSGHAEIFELDNAELDEEWFCEHE